MYQLLVVASLMSRLTHLTRQGLVYLDQMAGDFVSAGRILQAQDPATPLDATDQVAHPGRGDRQWGIPVAGFRPRSSSACRPPAVVGEDYESAVLEPTQRTGVTLRPARTTLTPPRLRPGQAFDPRTWPSESPPSSKEHSYATVPTDTSPAKSAEVKRRALRRSPRQCAGRARSHVARRRRDRQRLWPSHRLPRPRGARQPQCARSSKALLWCRRP